MNLNITKIIVSALVFIVFWNALDFILNVVISHGAFTFTAMNIIKPLVVSVGVDLICAAPSRESLA